MTFDTIVQFRSLTTDVSCCQMCHALKFVMLGWKQTLFCHLAVAQESWFSPLDDFANSLHHQRPGETTAHPITSFKYVFLPAQLVMLLGLAVAARGLCACCICAGAAFNILKALFWCVWKNMVSHILVIRTIQRHVECARTRRFCCTQTPVMNCCLQTSQGKKKPSFSMLFIRVPVCMVGQKERMVLNYRAARGCFPGEDGHGVFFSYIFWWIFSGIIFIFDCPFELGWYFVHSSIDLVCWGSVLCVEMHHAFMHICVYDEFFCMNMAHVYRLRE